MNLRALRRDRAARSGAELFLFERAFDDCLDRLSLVQRRFERALLIGCPDPHWRTWLGAFAADVDVRDPGGLFAEAAAGEKLIEDQWQPPHAAYDLVVALGTLDTVNDLPRALITTRWGMKLDGMFLGALSGGDTLPRLRSAMRAADAVTGEAAPHAHPRIEPSAFAQLLSQAGFANPVVDVDRVPVSYQAFHDLLKDLRRMGATNVLTARPKRMSKAAAAVAAQNFEGQAEKGRTTEVFEILHFACWTAEGDEAEPPIPGR